LKIIRNEYNFAPLFLLIMGGPIARSQQALNEALRMRAEGSQTT
jgi:hypothetical protein